MVSSLAALSVEHGGPGGSGGGAHVVGGVGASEQVDAQYLLDAYVQWLGTVGRDYPQSQSPSGRSAQPHA